MTVPKHVLQAINEAMTPKVKVRQQTPTVEAHDVELGHATVLFYVDHGRRLVDLSSVRVPTKWRRRGEASRALRYVTDLADRLHYAVRLDASPLDKKTNTAALVRLYERFGFLPTGRRINPVGDPEMRRGAR